jgi:hypothetical protein
VLGDLGVKIKEITNEGFISSFAKGLGPAAFQKVIDTPYKKQAELDAVDIAKSSYEKYGHNPEFVDPKTKKSLFPKKFGYMSWLTPYDLYTERNKIVAGMSDADKASLPNEIKAQLGIPVGNPGVPR